MVRFKFLIGLYIIAFVFMSSLKSFGATVTYTYDNLNRLTKVDYGNSFIEEYTYDPAGNRLTLVAKYEEKIPPTSGITFPSNNSTIWGYNLTIYGTASDAEGSGIQRVEVSIDDGLTWNTCTGTTTWSCTINFPSDGTYTIISRATDNAGNIEVPGAPVVVTVFANKYTLTCSDSGSIECMERADNGNDSNNLDASIGKPKVDIEYQFKVVVKDSTGSTPQYVRLYMTQRSNPTNSNFYAYGMSCSGSYSTGATCTYTTKLGPAAVHKFYFEAKMSDGTILRYPNTGYITGPEVQLLTGYNLVGLPRDINSANLDGSSAFGTTWTYRWDSDLEYYTKVTTAEPVKVGEGYFAYKEVNTLPEHASYGEIQDANYTYGLKHGWNIISNSYSGNVRLSDIKVKKGSATPISWTEAVTNGWLVNAIYYYNGRDWGRTYTFESTGGLKEATLIPWIGYWVYLNMSDDTYYLVFSKPAN